MIVSDLS